MTELYDFDDTVSVIDGRNETAKIDTTEHFVYPLTEQELKNLKFVYTYPDEIEAPLEKGSEIGKVEIFLNNDLLFSEKIFTIENVKPRSMLQRMRDFFRNW